MIDTIKEKLYEIQEKEKIIIHHAIESGSWGWGFESKDSDFDVRFIYIHQTEWYLNVFEGSDVIEIPIDEVFDINGWDLKKALKLIYKSNVPLLEWLSSPIIYKENESFIEELANIAKIYFSQVSVIYHYINLAKKSFSELLTLDNIKIKILFYFIRPIIACMWIEKYNVIPPMNLQVMLKEIEIDNKIKNIINELVIVKADSTEFDVIRPQIELMNFLKDKLQYYEAYAKNIKNERERDPSALNEFFHKVLKDYNR